MDMDKDQLNAWNEQIIEEFRSNAGKVGGPFEGATLLLLHHVGAKSGTERIAPLACFPFEGGFIIVASKAGAPTNPDWYHNLIAHPDVTVEFGTESLPVHARVANPEERDEMWKQIVSYAPGFGEYQTKTDRVIPVVVLEKTAA